MIKLVISCVLILPILIGCGGGGSGSDSVNTYKSENSLGFYGDLVLFSDYVVTGIWSQTEYDDNGNAKDTVAFNYRFDDDGLRHMQVPLLGDTWYPLGEYGVDEAGTKIFFSEGSDTMGYYQFIEKEEDTCIKIGHYSVRDNVTTLNDNYQFCKE
ncbi:MAG: hypothetical protein CL624_12995 [Arcobacter sp.]|nr:hypothetical protein [Arcobacter sp.]|tara:strand:- start:4973 stop:5437 length:465 start_codon:yes stop_codon:yes gene_type:complete